MASWKITLPSGTTHNGATISAGQYMAVAELLDGADWSKIEPTVGPRQLIAWVAVLAAGEGEGDVAAELVQVMQAPMVDIMRMLQVSE